MAAESSESAWSEDEHSMIAYTIIEYHNHLLTKFESAVICAFKLRWRSDSWAELLIRSPALPADVENAVQPLRSGTGHLRDPEIDRILDKGYDAFSREVAKRVMAEQAGEVVLNRCPKCGKIVRTPKAMQCMWCYHDWHLTLIE